MGMGQNDGRQILNQSRTTHGSHIGYSLKQEIFRCQIQHTRIRGSLGLLRANQSHENLALLPPTLLIFLLRRNAENGAKRNLKTPTAAKAVHRTSQKPRRASENSAVRLRVLQQYRNRGSLIPNIRKTREIIGNKSNHITLIYSVL